MKRILIFVISVLFSVNLTAQIGIDLTEMVNAPDSGYIIITTGDEYPERGLQKYVAFDSLIPLDTIFRSGDSVCLQFAYQTAPVCFALPDSTNENQTLSVLRDGDTIRRDLHELAQEGKIIKVHTADFDYKGHTRRASEDEPQYEIQSEKTDHVAAHKGSALRKID